MKIPLKCLKFLDKLNEKYSGNVYLANKELQELEERYNTKDLIELVERIGE